MLLPMARSRVLSLAAPVAPFNAFRPSVIRFSVALTCGAMALLLALAAVNVRAQQAAPAPAATSQTPAQTQSSPATPQPAQTPAPTPAPAPAETQPAPAPAVAHGSAGQAPEPGSITEDELRKQLEGKDLFLRGGYLDNTLTFNEHGVLIGHSPQGSYTLVRNPHRQSAPA